jgi:hypothetical protein
MDFLEENALQLLEEQGYYIVPLLSAFEVNHLLAIQRDSPIQIGAFTASAHLEETEIRKSISRELKKVIEPRLNELVQGVDVLGASFVIKSPGYNEILQPHQDWNIVDERHYRSYNIWIPLTDTCSENGAVMVMPGSHKWINTFRHSSIPCAFREVHKELIDHMITLEIPAGFALIYDHALIHASHANTSNESRIAIAAGIKPQEAEMLFYWNENGVVEVYDADENHFMEKNIFQRPTALLKRKEILYDFPTVNYKMLCSFIGKEYTEESIGDAKPWFKVYTPLNIFKEIVYRLSPNKK